MPTYHLLWIIPLFGVGFAVFWWLICHFLALLGWRRLAAHFASDAAPAPTAHFRLGRAAVGGVSYKNAIGAAVSPAGMALRVASIFRPGHPPLLIPWAAIGAVQQQRQLWTTYFSVPVHLGSDSIELRFTDERLARALQQ